MHPKFFTGKMLFTLLTLLSFIGIITVILPIPRFATTAKGIGNASVLQKELSTELSINQTKISVKHNFW